MIVAKRYFSICLLIIALMLLFPVAAYADVIWTPPDSFYEKNYEKCDHLNRMFYANGERGYVSAKKEPGSNTDVGAIINGGQYHVSFTYEHRGERWGVIMLDGWGTGTRDQIRTGWVPMDQLVLVYDQISFSADHSHEFYDYSGDYGALFEVKELIFWTWPGSGQISMVHDNPTLRDREPAKDWLMAAIAYKDSEGREWGFIPYFFASRSNWVCLSDPGNRDIPAFNPALMPELFPPADPSELPASGNGILTLLIIIFMVAALVIGTAVLIRVFWKPKKAN